MMATMITSVEWPDALVLVLVDAALKGAVVIAIAALAAALLRRRSAALRHAIWTTAVLAQLALPALALVLPTWRVPLAWAPAWLAAARTATMPTDVRDETSLAPKAAAIARADASADDVAPLPPVQTSAAATPATTTPATPPRAWRVLPLVWATGVAVVLLGLVAGTVGVWRLAHRGRRVHDGNWLSLTQQLADRLQISRPLTLLQGADVRVPVTWGVVYPVVLLPPDAERWDAEQRRYVLVHEMAHVRRLDALTQLVAQLAVALFWFHPLVWLAAARMRREREHACDDYVLREGTCASRYADDLLAMVRALGSTGRRRAQPAFAALAMARPSELEGRMLAILDPAHDRHPLRTRGACMLAILAAVVLLPLAALRPDAAAAAVVAERMPVTPAPANVARPAPPTADPSQPPRAAGEARGSGIARAAATVLASAVDGMRQQEDDRCSAADVRRRSGSSTSINQNDDDGDREFAYYASSPGRCAEAELRGQVEFSADERRVTRMSVGAVARFRERTASADRRVTFVRAADGGVRAEVTVDGRRVEDAGAWVAGIIQEVLRESGYDAPARVARLHADGGIDAVMAMIDQVRSDGAKRTHYQALLGMEGLPADEVERTVRHATRTLVKSDGDLRGVLEHVPARGRDAAGVRAALAEGVGTIRSDGDRRTLLSQYVMTGDRDLVLASLQGVRTMRSDGDKRAVLVTGVVPALGRDDTELRAAFFEAARTIRSDGDLSAVLVTATPHARAVPAVTEAILDLLDQVRSDGDAARVLVTLAHQRVVDTRELRARYVAAARRLSEADQRRALAALPEAP